MHSINWNIWRKKFKIATWNKGSTHLKISIQILSKTITEQKVDICGIQELNLRQTDNLDTLQIPGYDIITDQHMKPNQISRAAIIIRNDIKYRYRPDLTDPNEAHVAIIVQVTKKTSFNVHSWYCQWQQINLQGRIKETGTIKAQKSRINSVTEFFKKSINERETLILADANINSKYLTTPNSNKPPLDRQISGVSEIYKTKIISSGYTLINHKPTKPKSKDEMTYIDHISPHIPT